MIRTKPGQDKGESPNGQWSWGREMEIIVLGIRFFMTLTNASTYSSSFLPFSVICTNKLLIITRHFSSMGNCCKKSKNPPFTHVKHIKNTCSVCRFHAWSGWKSNRFLWVAKQLATPTEMNKKSSTRGKYYCVKIWLSIAISSLSSYITINRMVSKVYFLVSFLRFIVFSTFISSSEKRKMFF